MITGKPGHRYYPHSVRYESIYSIDGKNMEAERVARTRRRKVFVQHCDNSWLEANKKLHSMRPLWRKLLDVYVEFKNSSKKKEQK